MGVGIVIGIGFPARLASGPPSFSRDESDATEPSAVTAAASLPAGELDLDLGTQAAAGALRDGWNRAAQLDGRNVALISAARATMSLRGTSMDADAVLALVARAVGLAEDAQLKVVVHANETKLTELDVSGAWQLLAVRIPRALWSTDQTTLRFLLDDATSAAADAQPVPTMAIDHLWLGSLPDANGIDLATAGGRALLLQGFWQTEPTGQDDAFAVWTRGTRSTVALVLAPKPEPYQLGLHAHVFAPIGAVTVKARVNGYQVGRTEIEKQDDYVFNVPNEVLRAGANTIEFECSKSGKPSDYGSAHDTREMCLRVYSVLLTPHDR